MGLRWYKQVWADKRLCGKAASYKLVMLALAEYADDETGQCWPGIDLLCEMTGLSDRQIQRVLNDLMSDGYINIERVHGRSKSNTYTLKGDAHDAKGDTCDTFNAEEKVTPMSPIAAKKVTWASPFSKEKVTSTTEKVTPMSPDPIDPKDDHDHLPGRLLRAMVEGAGFMYMDRNFNEIAGKLEADYSHEQLIRALQSTKEAHQKKIGNGERGITSPLAYMKSVLLGDGSDGTNSNGAKHVVKVGKPAGVFVGKVENLR